jgi:hypothetical protein
MKDIVLRSVQADRADFYILTVDAYGSGFLSSRKRILHETRHADVSMMASFHYPSLIVIDDLMRDATNNKDVCELFVEGGH